MNLITHHPHVGYLHPQAKKGVNTLSFPSSCEEENDEKRQMRRWLIWSVTFGLISFSFNLCANAKETQWTLEKLGPDDVLALSGNDSEGDKLTFECNGIQQKLWLVRSISIDSQKQDSFKSGAIKIGTSLFPLQVTSKMNSKPFIYSAVVAAKKEFLRALVKSNKARIEFPNDNIQVELDHVKRTAFAMQCSEILGLEPG